MVEATAGNTGLGLALVARAKGYRVVLVVPDKMSTEKVLHLKALGAEVHITRSRRRQGPSRLLPGLRGAARAARSPARSSPTSSTTRPTRWRTRPAPARRSGQQMRARRRRDRRRRRLGRHAHRADALLPQRAARSSTSCSPTRSARSSPSTRAAARSARPARGRSKASAKTSSRRSPTCRACAHAYSIADEESFGTARELLRAEGILGGSSTGTLLAAALRYCREQTTPKRVVSFVCDTGTRYLSKVYNDQWMIDQGLLRAARATATCAT